MPPSKVDFPLNLVSQLPTAEAGGLPRCYRCENAVAGAAPVTISPAHTRELSWDHCSGAK
jgi:hypothetical protein